MPSDIVMRYYIIHLGVKDDDTTNAFKRFYWDSIFPVGTIRGNNQNPVTEVQSKDVVNYCFQKDLDLVIVSNCENPIMAQNVMNMVVDAAKEYSTF